MNESMWYVELIRPNFAPPSWIFGPVWSILYVVIAITFGYIGYSYIQKRIPGKVALPFLLNIIFNLLFTPLQFGLKNNTLAALDILLVLITIVWMFVAVYKFDKSLISNVSNVSNVSNALSRSKKNIFSYFKYFLYKKNRTDIVSKNLSTGYMWVIYANIPYFIWVSFATVLQFTITYLNW